MSANRITIETTVFHPATKANNSRVYPDIEVPARTTSPLNVTLEGDDMGKLIAQARVQLDVLEAMLS